MSINLNTEIFYRPPSKVASLSIDVEMVGNVFQTMLDTGCNDTLVLKDDSLKKVGGLTFFSRQDVSDAFGNISSLVAYKVGKAKLAGISFDNCIVLKARKNLEGGLGYYDMDGVVGSPFFRRIGSLFADVSNNSEVFFHQWNNHELIVQKGYDLGKFVKISLSKPENYDLLTLPIETDFGTFRFIIDTGSSLSFIEPSLANVQVYEKVTFTKASYCTTKLFKIGERDFGSTDLALAKLNPNFGFDGILGMDFLQKYAFDLDVEHQALMIGDSLNKLKKD